jgi:hypothetical protein
MKTFLTELERELERQNQELARFKEAAQSIDPELTLVFDAGAIAFMDEPLPAVSFEIPLGVRV